MVQLSNDSFANNGKMLSLSDAQKALRTAAQSVGTKGETLALNRLAGRILRQDTAATRNVPPFLNSAVDGYAFAAGPGSTRNVAGSLVAGDTVPKAPLAQGDAMRVLTGAPLPVGADTVMMDEDATFNKESLIVDNRLKPGSNARPEGEDIRCGDVLYTSGHIVRTIDLARLAAGGVETAQAHQPLKIHILSTGDELVNGQIVDSNCWMIASVFSESAFELSFGAPLPDDLNASEKALMAINADLVLTSGGVSVGERDFLRRAIDSVGSLEFWRIGIKPGRPVAFGSLGDGTPIFGLPGNSVACLITALFLARPYALAMMGAKETLPTLQVPFGTAYKKKPHRTEFVRVSLDKQGFAHPYKVAGAGVISSVTQSHALAILGDDVTEIAKGSPVPILPLKGLL